MWKEWTLDETRFSCLLILLFSSSKLFAQKKKIGIFKLLSYNISTPSHTILEWFISGAFWWFLIFCKYCTIYLAPACIWKGRWVTRKAFVWSICYPLRLMIIFCISFEIFDKEKSHLHITALYFLIYCLSFLFLA